jgi:surfeit locus 1 family protein
MSFRPYLGVTIAALIAAAILIGLGVWQLQRLTWKENLIATVNGHMQAAPISLDQALAMNQDDVQYRKVALSGRFDNAKEAYVFTTGAEGVLVYHVLVPFITDDGRTLMVDRGEIPQEKLAPQSRRPVEGETHVTGVWRVPDAPGMFTPAPVPQKHIWYARDLAGIAAADGVKLAAPVLIEADSTPNPGGSPVGGQTVVDFPNNHLEYALTWFGLAAGLFGVYLAFHISKGRLTFGGPLSRP